MAQHSAAGDTEAQRGDALVRQRGWELRELHRRLPSLEDVFVELAAAEPPRTA